MNHITDFVLIIISQLTLYFVVCYLSSVSIKDWISALVWGMLIGIPFGILFDLIFGFSLEIFHYHLGWNSIFLFFNGMLSYGVALSTVMVFVCVNDNKQDLFARKNHLSWHVTALILVGVAIIYGFDNVILNMLLGGLAILFGSEIVFKQLNKPSLIELLLNGKFRQVLNIYYLSVMLGGWYEISNLFFPVWAWSLGMYLSQIVTVTVIVLFGYFTLVIAMSIAAVIGMPQLTCARR